MSLIRRNHYFYEIYDEIALSHNFPYILEKIIDVAKWVTNNIKGIFSKIGDALGSVGNFFGDLFSGNLFKKNNGGNTTNNTTNNSVTVNTSSASFDIDSINKALGGAY